MIGLIGKKLGMTQIFDEKGNVIPVTVIKATPNRVIMRKTEESDGYDAVQLGLEEIAERKVNKPLMGHFKKHNSPAYRYLKEFRLKMYKDIEEGEIFDVSMFSEHEMLKVTGISKGKGFQGVIKRHGFGGGRATHGSMFHRAPGSIGQCAWPSRVFPGKKLPGQMGNKKVTVKGLKVVGIDKENNLLIVKGAVPGSRGSYVFINKA